MYVMSRQHHRVATPLMRTTFVFAVHCSRSASTMFWRVASVFSDSAHGVLEVEEDLVGGQRAGLGEHLRARAGDGEAGSAEAHPGS